MYIHRNARERNHNFINPKKIKQKIKPLAIDRSRPNPLRLNCISSLHAHSHSQTHTHIRTTHILALISHQNYAQRLCSRSEPGPFPGPQVGVAGLAECRR